MDARDCDPVRPDVDDPPAVAGLALKVMSRLAARDRPDPDAIRPAVVEQLTATILSDDQGWSAALYADLRRAGVSRVLFADLYLPEIARKLGDAWVDDRLSFVAVTVGNARLQSILRDIGRDWSADHDPVREIGARTALLIIPAEEQHTLGGMVLLGHLRRRGISVALRIGPGHAELRRLMTERQFDAVLISIGQEAAISPCRTLIAALRRISGDRVRVAVGGAAMELVRDLRVLTGADMASNNIVAVIRDLGLEQAGAGPLTLREPARHPE